MNRSDELVDGAQITTVERGVFGTCDCGYEFDPVADRRHMLDKIEAHYKRFGPDATRHRQQIKERYGGVARSAPDVLQCLRGRGMMTALTLRERIAGEFVALTNRLANSKSRQDRRDAGAMAIYSARITRARERPA